MGKHKSTGRFVCPKANKFVNNAYIIYNYQRHVELQSFENIFLSLRETESERVKLLFIKN